MKQTLKLLAGSAMVAAALGAAPVHAFKPERPIEFMVHSGPGAGNDVFARAVQGLLEKTKLAPQTINILNKTGGGGLVAMSYLGEKKGEAHLLAVFTSVWFVNPQIREKAKVTMQDLTPIARLILEPAVMTVRADSPYKTAKAFFDAAKANPGKMKQSGGSLTSRDNTLRQLLMKETGANWQFISMKSGGERVAALLGGHVDMYIMEPAEAEEQIRAGKIRVLATLMDKRIPSLPDVATIKEQGYNIPEVPQARGFVGPPGMAADVKNYYVELLSKLHKTPEWAGFLKDNRYEDGFLTGPGLDKFFNEYTQTMRGILKEAGIKLVR
jgi:putative tricarboxylic transport membrane protein